MNKNRRRGVEVCFVHTSVGRRTNRPSGQSLAAYAVEFQQQYEALSQQRGSEASASARNAGRELIRTKGFAEIQTMLELAGLLNLNCLQPRALVHQNASPIPHAASSGPESEGLLRRAAYNCRRKPRHINFLSALLHARRLEDQSLNIYGCPICRGLHVEHRQDAEARRRRSISKELETLDRQIEELERNYIPSRSVSCIASLVLRRVNQLWTATIS